MAALGVVMTLTGFSLAIWVDYAFLPLGLAGIALTAFTAPADYLMGRTDRGGPGHGDGGFGGDGGGGGGC